MVWGRGKEFEGREEEGAREREAEFETREKGLGEDSKGKFGWEK